MRPSQAKYTYIYIYIMQASLCLQTKSHAGHHFAFNLRKSRTILHCHRQLSHSPSLLFSTRLHGGPRPRLTTPVMRARITPSEDSSLNKARKHAVRSAATAAMVIACTLGAMSTSFEARAYSNGDIPPAANFVLKETINALQGALECDTGPQKQVRDRPRWTFYKKKKEPLRVSLLKILQFGLDSVARNKFKQILDIEKADLETISLKPALDAWNQIDERKQSDKYYIGMVLIDLLISKGEYKKAVEICRKIEGYDQMKDGSIPVRREVLNALLKQAPGPPNVY